MMKADILTTPKKKISLIFLIMGLAYLDAYKSYGYSGRAQGNYSAEAEMRGPNDHNANLNRKFERKSQYDYQLGRNNYNSYEKPNKNSQHKPNIQTQEPNTDLPYINAPTWHHYGIYPTFGYDRMDRLENYTEENVRPILSNENLPISELGRSLNDVMVVIREGTLDLGYKGQNVYNEVYFKKIDPRSDFQRNSVLFNKLDRYIDADGFVFFAYLMPGSPLYIAAMAPYNVTSVLIAALPEQSENRNDNSHSYRNEMFYVDKTKEINLGDSKLVEMDLTDLELDDSTSKLALVMFKDDNVNLNELELTTFKQMKNTCSNREALKKDHKGLVMEAHPIKYDKVTGKVTVLKTVSDSLYDVPAVMYYDTGMKLKPDTMINKGELGPMLVVDL